MLPRLLDKGARDGIGTVAIAGGPQIDALLHDLATRALAEMAPHELRQIPSRRDEDERLDALCFWRCLCHQLAQQKERNAPAHAGADPPRGAAWEAECRARLREPISKRALLEASLRLAMT